MRLSNVKKIVMTEPNHIEIYRFGYLSLELSTAMKNLA